MHNQSLYFYCDKFELYNFGHQHPFSPIRQKMADSLIHLAGLITECEKVNNITPASLDILQLIHTPKYIQAVKKASENPQVTNTMYGLGTADNPCFYNMHQAAAIRVGATVEAFNSLYTDQADHAVNLGGGLHHAWPDFASGFCIYNDVAVAIELAIKKGIKVAYIDLDAHHGDGVQECFYDSSQALTISIHQSGYTIFPGTGHIEELGINAGYKTNINIPLQPQSSDYSWWYCFENIIVPAVEMFNPDMIISLHGTDAHILDPLANLKISMNPMKEAACWLHTLAHKVCNGKWLAVAGGGYSLNIVARVWAILWAIAAHRYIPKNVPKEWLEKWCPGNEIQPLSILDDPQSDDPDIKRYNIQTAKEIQNIVFG